MGTAARNYGENAVARLSSKGDSISGLRAQGSGLRAQGSGPRAHRAQGPRAHRAQVASGFSRKIYVGGYLPPKGGSHTS
jgi:hypothetical protein